MAKEPDNLVLTMLREIRGDIRDMKSKLEEHDKRFDGVDKNLDSMRYQMTHILGIAGMSNISAVRAEEKADDTLTLHKRVDERLSDVERRVRVLEETRPSS